MTRRSIAKPYTIIPGPEPTSKRNREWERQQRQQIGQATYRIPNSLRISITTLSKDLNVTSSELARFFLEHALQAYQSGDLEINPSIRVGKYTLYPPD